VGGMGGGVGRLVSNRYNHHSKLLGTMAGPPISLGAFCLVAFWVKEYKQIHATSVQIPLYQLGGLVGEGVRGNRCVFRSTFQLRMLLGEGGGNASCVPRSTVKIAKVLKSQDPQPERSQAQPEHSQSTARAQPRVVLWVLGRVNEKG